jgi:hypothetical protein
MQDFVHQIDPTRPVTAALHPVRNSKGERDAPLAEIANLHGRHQHELSNALVCA